MFANILAGSIIMYLMYAACAYVLSLIVTSPVQIYLLGPIITPLFHLYFDLFSGIIQSYIFVLLTMIY